MQKCDLRCLDATILGCVDGAEAGVVCLWGRASTQRHEGQSERMITVDRASTIPPCRMENYLCTAQEHLAPENREILGGAESSSLDHIKC